MLKRYLLHPPPPVWIVSLILVSLILTACGGAAEPTGEVAAPVETEEATISPTDDEAQPAEEQQTATTEETATEESPTEEAEAASDENLLAPDQEASTEANCQAVNPINDPMAKIMNFVSDYIDGTSPNAAIAAVTDTDWAKGPADAPVTFIEYGDFQ